MIYGNSAYLQNLNLEAFCYHKNCIFIEDEIWQILDSAFYCYVLIFHSPPLFVFNLARLICWSVAGNFIHPKRLFQDICNVFVVIFFLFISVSFLPVKPFILKAYKILAPDREPSDILLKVQKRIKYRLKY